MLPTEQLLLADIVLTSAVADPRLRQSVRMRTVCKGSSPAEQRIPQQGRRRVAEAARRSIVEPCFLRKTLLFQGKTY